MKMESCHRYDFDELNINLGKFNLKGKTVLIPEMNRIAAHLFAANFRGFGVKAKVLETDGENIPVQFYSGISYIELGQYQNALHPFDFIMEHNQNLYVERAEWYAALCFLKLNDNEHAVELFRQISLSNSSYKDKAHEILKSIQD